jgi:tRNA (adenine57-N1/adenine58-N1)-methyltransferase
MPALVEVEACSYCEVRGLCRKDFWETPSYGFLVTSRRLSPGVVPPKAQRRTKPEFEDSDIETWTPGAVGDREQSEKRLRRAVRDAEALAENARRLGE